MKTSHVQIVPRDVAEAIRDTLEADGFVIGAAPYALFEARGHDVRVTYYDKRGKLLIQGQGTEGLLRRLGDRLGAQEDPGPDEDAGISEPTVGSDESGKGDYFGSLVVAGCLVKPEDVPALRSLGVRDSKQATEVAILAACEQIRRRVETHVVELEPPEYTRRQREAGNVNRVLGEAHAEVIRELLKRGDCGRVVVDRFGGEHYVLRELGELARGRRIVQVPGAEKNPAVAAASFLARERFLLSLKRLSDECGVDLLPGASAEVEERARKVFQVGGMDLLSRVAKIHFKTTERVVSE